MSLSNIPQNHHFLNKEISRSEAMRILSSRISVSKGRYLKVPVARKFAKIVGWSIPELYAHLEKHFCPGMGWNNIHLWHIEHTVPLSYFKFKTHDCEKYRHAWSLSNIRPMWAHENHKKNRKVSREDLKRIKTQSGRELELAAQYKRENPIWHMMPLHMEKFIKDNMDN